MMDKKPFGIIYKVTNKINAKVYIGQTTRDFIVRKEQHLKEAYYNKHNIPFHKAIRKYGSDYFIWEIIDYCDSKEILNELEFHYIMQFSSLNSGYNCTLGGEGSSGFVKPPVGERTRKKMSVAKKRVGKWSGKNNPKYNKGYLIQGKNNGMFGKKHSKETREKISKALSGSKHPFYGKKIPIEQRKKMDENRSHWWLIIFPDGNKIIIRNLSSFCNKYNLSDGAMNNVARGLRKHHKGFKCKKIYDFRIERVGKC